MEQPNLKNRTVFCRDNIEVLQGLNSNTIDLIYLDPPFSKNDTFITKDNKNIAKIKNFFIEEQQKYNRFPDEDFEEIFKDNTASFSDIWTENDINNYYYSQIDKFNNKLVDYLDSIKDFAIKGGFYYLLYMTVRLIEMKRILKDTGSIYYHCDPTFSHYIKAVMDRIFGRDNFRNEIVWHYPNKFSRIGDFFARMSDTIFFYSKTNNYCFNKLDRERANLKDDVRGFAIRKKDKKILVYDDEKASKIIKEYSAKGFKIQRVIEKPKMSNVWFDINIIASQAKERTGYPTQKPLALLERIIKASSREGDIVLDPFCGCATTCIASEKLNRQWVGIDWNKQSFYMIYYRAYSINLEGKKYGRSIATHLIPRDDAPQRTDISREELNKIHQDLQYKQTIKQTKKIRRMSLEDKAIAKEILYEAQAGICNGCDAYMRSVDLTIDHLIPQAQGGDDNLDNLQLLCYRCNNWKRTKDMQFLFNKLFEEKIISLGTYNKQMATINN